MSDLFLDVKQRQCVLSQQSIKYKLKHKSSIIYPVSTKLTLEKLADALALE